MDKTIRVLLIDDEEDFLSSMSKVLTRRGLQITTALGGQAALAVLNKDEFDIILTDLKMPDMDGLETVKAIHAAGHQIPILILSGIFDFAKVTSAVKQGIVDFIPKTCTPDEIVVALENAHERYCCAKILEGDLNEKKGRK
jgi:DNA-binding NtrC family response regulator